MTLATSRSTIELHQHLVHTTGVEPVCLAALVSKTSVSANSTTCANLGTPGEYRTPIAAFVALLPSIGGGKIFGGSYSRHRQPNVARCAGLEPASRRGRNPVPSMSAYSVSGCQ